MISAAKSNRPGFDSGALRKTIRATDGSKGHDQHGKFSEQNDNDENTNIMMMMVMMMMMTVRLTMCSLGRADNLASLQNSLPPRFNSCAAAVAKPSADRSRIPAPQPQCACDMFRITLPRLPRPRRHMHWQSPVPSSKSWQPCNQSVQRDLPAAWAQYHLGRICITSSTIACRHLL